MDRIKHARLLLLATVALFSVSGPRASAQFGSGTVLQQQMINYLNQMMNSNAGASSNTATNTGTQTTTATDTGPLTMGPTMTLPPPPPPPEVTTPAPPPPPPPNNQVSNLYQQILQMSNNMNTGVQVTTTSNSIYANPYVLAQTTPPPTQQPATQGPIPFDPWINQQTSTNSVQQNPTTTGTTGTGTQQPFKLTSWEQYQPHPDPWSQNKPTAAPPKPALPPTPIQLMQTYVPLTLQQRMIDAGRTGFVKPTVYFEEHGCVDPRTALPPGTPTPGLVLSCQSAQSQRVCQQVGAAAGAGGEAPAFDMNSFVMKGMPGYKRLLEVCLSPNIMSKIQMQQQMSMMKMFSSMFNRNANTHTHTNTNTHTNMMTGGLHPMVGIGGLGSTSGQGGWSGATQPGSGGFSNTGTTAQTPATGMIAPTTAMPPTANPGSQPQTGMDTGMPSMTSALDAMFGSQGSTGTGPVSGRRKRQASPLFSLYQSLFNTGSSPYRTLTSGAATVPTGTHQMNSVSSPSSGFGTPGSLLGSHTGSLPSGAAHPSGSTSSSSFTAPTDPASLPFGAAAPSSNAATGMNDVFGSLFGGFGGSTSGTGATSAPVPEPDISQCQQILPMLLMQAGVEGPMGSPEAMEALVDVRKQMLPYECQEFPTMNFRMCCPGKVSPPTFQEMMMAGRNAGA